MEPGNEQTNYVKVMKSFHIEYETLPAYQQREYLDKAEYLVRRGYMFGNIEEIAKRIYTKSKYANV